MGDKGAGRRQEDPLIQSTFGSLRHHQPTAPLLCLQTRLDAEITHRHMIEGPSLHTAAP